MNRRNTLRGYVQRATAPMAVMIAAVTFLATSAWADPGKGQSEKWIQLDDCYNEGIEEIPCLGVDEDGFPIQVHFWGYWRFLINYRTTPEGTTGWTLKWGPAENACFMEILNGPEAGKLFIGHADYSGTENGHCEPTPGFFVYTGDPVDPSEWGNLPESTWGVANCHQVFEAENGDLLVRMQEARYDHWSPIDNSITFTSFHYEWTCK